MKKQAAIALMIQAAMQRGDEAAVKRLKKEAEGKGYTVILGKRKRDEGELE